MTLPSEAPVQPPLLIKNVPSLRRLKTRAEDMMKWSPLYSMLVHVIQIRSRKLSLELKFQKRRHKESICQQIKHFVNSPH